MTQEEKDLLLKDLCGRLPYYTIISVNDGKYREDVKLHPHYIFDWDAYRWDAKPYLRPLSSMTKEEIEDYCNLRTKQWDVHIDDYWYYDTVESIDWLNKKMFDYRGLIEKGLALPAPKGMYNF